MNSTEIRQLWLYAQEIWGATFVIPDDEVRRAVKLQVWLDVLGDLDVDLVRRTVVGMDSHFAPTPPELRAAALERQRLESGERKTPDVDQVLEELRRLVSHHGHWDEFGALDAAAEFHPSLLAAINAMGWFNICASEEPEVMRGQFRHIYEVASSRIERESFALAPAIANHIAELANTMHEIGEES